MIDIEKLVLPVPLSFPKTFPSNFCFGHVSLNCFSFFNCFVQYKVRSSLCKIIS